MTNEQLQNINATLKNQRDNAELNVSILVRMIEDDLWGYLSKQDQDKVIKKLNDMGL